MSPISIFAAILVLAVATRPATSQMGEGCADGINECTNSIMGKMSGGSMPPGGPCGLMQGFVDCLMGLSCPVSKAQLDSNIENAMAPLAAHGITCDIKTDGSGSATGSGSQGGMGASAGMDMMGEGCADGITECTNSLMGKMSGGSMPPGGPCGLMQGFVDCLMGLSCPVSKAQLDSTIENAMAPLAAQGLKCDIKTDGSGSATGSGSQGGMGASAGMDMSGMSQECAAAMAKCTKEYTDSMTGEMAGGVCSVLKKYTDCIGGVPCGMDEDTKAKMVASIYTPLQKGGVNCDAETETMIHTSSGAGGEGAGAAGAMDAENGTMIHTSGGAGGAGAGAAGAMDAENGTMILTSGGAGGAGAGAAGPMALFFQIQEKFSKHKCGAVPQGCSKKHGGDSPFKPSCDEVKKTAQCMFAECPAIQGTVEGTEAADILVKFAKGVQCTFTASELQKNGSHAIFTAFTASKLQNNGSPAIVTGSVLVLMLSALVTMFFV